jgi:hypothetical protein
VKSKNCGVFQDGRFRSGYPSLSLGRRIIRGRNPGQECDIYKRRETESAYEILIVRHLVPNDTKFKEYLPTFITRIVPLRFELHKGRYCFKTKQSNKKTDFSRTKTLYFSEVRTNNKIYLSTLN